MKRIGRVMLDVITVFSLLLCVAALVPWARGGTNHRFERGDVRLWLGGYVDLVWDDNGWSYYRLHWTAEYPSLVIVTAALPLMRVKRLIARRRLRPPGFCAACGYDLRASPGRCPECGGVPAS